MALPSETRSRPRCRRCGETCGCPCGMLAAISEGIAPKEDLTLALSSEYLLASDTKPTEMLFLGPFAVSYEVERQSAYWSGKLTEWLVQTGDRLGLGQASEQGSPSDLEFQGMPIRKLRVVICEPTYDIPSAVDGKGYWAQPAHPKRSPKLTLTP